MRIVVIGSGISGLGTAWLLSRAHHVDLIEADSRLGGHAHTSDVVVDGVKMAIDTGFMVFNDRTYTNLVPFFAHLGVGRQAADMTFSVMRPDIDLEWCGTSLDTVFAQRRNLFNPRFLGMLLDVLRMSRSADRLLRDESLDDLSLGEMLDREGFGEAFRDWYLVPIGSAIWSTPPQRMLSFPAGAFLRFCDNHGLLHVTGKPQWMSVPGGSRTYVRAVTDDISGDVITSTPVRSVKRGVAGVEVHAEGLGPQTYDAVVIAAHAPQALSMLDEPTDAEQRVLGSFAYQPNDAVVHSDAAFLPRRRRAHAAWNYCTDASLRDDPNLSVTYYLNRLQQLPGATPVLCSIDPIGEPAAESVIATHHYEHPLFDRAAVEAQALVPVIQGVDRIWYAGAWQRNGFHEDGLWSAIRVAADFGIAPPWGGASPS